MFQVKNFIIFSLLLVSLTFTSKVFAKDYIIFSISQDLPMGLVNEELKKNYYVNFGKNQGIKPGTILDVFRSIEKQDPYETSTRYTYKVKIGELEVLHAEDDAAIASMTKIEQGAKTPLFEIKKLMVGDEVKVQLN